MRNSNHSPLDSTGSAAESTISSAVNDESNHAISNAVDSSNELNGKDMDASSTMINETSSDDITKASAIDASSTNEDEDSGKLCCTYSPFVQSKKSNPFSKQRCRLYFFLLPI